MNQKAVSLVALYIFVFLLFVGCQPTSQPLMPVTGDKDNASALAEQARENVLAYLVSSSRLESALPDVDWHLDEKEQREGKYRYQSGDWSMVLWRVEANDRWHAIIINRTEKACWSGYIKPDGHVVDTTFLP